MNNLKNRELLMLCFARFYDLFYFRRSLSALCGCLSFIDLPVPRQQLMMLSAGFAKLILSWDFVIIVENVLTLIFAMLASLLVNPTKVTNQSIQCKNIAPQPQRLTQQDIFYKPSGIASEAKNISKRSMQNWGIFQSKLF